jgi:hypothetical protein
MIGPAGSLLICLFARLSVCTLGNGVVDGEYEYVEVLMPNTTTYGEDAYLAISVKLPDEEAYLVGFEPRASANKVHHMLLYGCEVPTPKANGKSSVLMIPMCASGPDAILYGWAMDAPKLDFPEDVGIVVGGDTPIKYVVLQVSLVRFTSTFVADT